MATPVKGFVKGMARPPGAGRKAGTPNKSSKQLRDILLPLTPLAVKQLKGLLQDDDPNVRQKAITEVFDRTYGKATQTLNHKGGIGVAHVNLEKLDDDQLESLLAIVVAGEGTDVPADIAGDPSAPDPTEDGGDQS